MSKKKERKELLRSYKNKKIGNAIFGKSDEIYIGLWVSDDLELPMIVYDDYEIVEEYMEYYVGCKNDNKKLDYDDGEDYKEYIIECVKNKDDSLYSKLNHYYKEISRKYDIDVTLMDPWPNIYMENMMGIIISNLDAKLIRNEFDKFIRDIDVAYTTLVKAYFLIKRARNSKHSAEFGNNVFSNFIDNCAEESAIALKKIENDKKKKRILFKIMAKTISPYLDLSLEDFLSYISDDISKYDLFRTNITDFEEKMRHRID